MIDEKKLIEDIKGWQEDIHDNEYDAKKYDFVFERIYEMAEEQPKVREWIPCSERLPDKPEENPMFEGAKVELYLVSCGEESYPFRAFWNGKDFTDGLCKVDAVAWMPLPEPYKEGE